MEGKLELHMNAEAARLLSEAIQSGGPLILTAAHKNATISFHLAAHEVVVARVGPWGMLSHGYGREYAVTIGVRQVIPAAPADTSDASADENNHVRDAVLANQ